MLTEQVVNRYLPYHPDSAQACIGKTLQGYEILRKGDELVLRIRFIEDQGAIEVLQFLSTYSVERSEGVHRAAANITPHLGKTLSSYDVMDNRVHTWMFGDKGFTLMV